MTFLSSDLKFNIGLTERLMPFLTAILVFMSVLMLMFSMYFRQWLNESDKNVDTQMSIQILLDKNEKLSLEEKTDHIISKLSQFDYVKMAREIDPQEMEEMMSPWLKSGFTDLDLEMPAMVNVELTEDGKSKQKELAAALEKDFSKISIESHQDWLDALNSFTNIARKLSFSFSTLMLTAMVLLIMQVTLLTLNVQKSTINLLSILGANDHYIASRFQNHILKFGAIGGLIGFILALIVIYSIAFKLRKLNFSMPHHFLPGDGQFLILVLAPLFLILIMGITARLTAFYHLRRK